VVLASRSGRPRCSAVRGSRALRSRGALRGARGLGGALAGQRRRRRALAAAGADPGRGRLLQGARAAATRERGAAAGARAGEARGRRGDGGWDRARGLLRGRAREPRGGRGGHA